MTDNLEVFFALPCVFEAGAVGDLLFGGVAVEVSEPQEKFFLGDQVAWLEDAGGFAGHGLFVLKGAEKASSLLGLMVAFHASSWRIEVHDTWTE